MKYISRSCQCLVLGKRVCGFRGLFEEVITLSILTVWSRLALFDLSGRVLLVWQLAWLFDPCLIAHLSDARDVDPADRYRVNESPYPARLGLGLDHQTDLAHGGTDHSQAQYRREADRPV